jgi:hypothetical protein
MDHTKTASWLRDLAGNLNAGALDAEIQLRGVIDLNTLADWHESESAGYDRRTTPRLIRVRLYQGDMPDPMADTDPDLPADAFGTWQVAGLPAMAEALQQVAAGYHGDAVAIMGLDTSTLLHRIKGLRPTLSRRGGNATWRVPYMVQGAAWRARVDLRNA